MGSDNETMIYWGGRLDSKGLLLTGNTTVVYTFMWIDLKDRPMVMEIQSGGMCFRFLGDGG